MLLILLILNMMVSDSPAGVSKLNKVFAGVIFIIYG